MAYNPVPHPTTDLRRWAAEIAAYLNQLEIKLETPAPKIVQLEHQRDSNPKPASATQDGILMWRSSDRTVVVTRDGAWHVLMDQAGADARYVNVSGDVMTGELVVPSLRIHHTSPGLTLYDTTAAPDSRMIYLANSDGDFYLQARTDAGVFQRHLLIARRNGEVVVPGVLYASSHLNVTGNANVTGKVTAGADIEISTPGEGGQLILREPGSGKVGNLDMLAVSNSMRIYHSMGGTIRSWTFGSSGSFNSLYVQTTAIGAGGAAPSDTIAVHALPTAYTADRYSFVAKGKNASTNAIVSTGAGLFYLPITYTDSTTAAAANMVIASGGVVQRSTSSGVFKRNVRELSDSVQRLRALRPVSFTSTHETDDHDRVFMGFIAEDVEAAIPEAATDGGQNYDMRAITAVLVHVVQQLLDRVDRLEATIDGGAR